MASLSHDHIYQWFRIHSHFCIHFPLSVVHCFSKITCQQCPYKNITMQIFYFVGQPTSTFKNKTIKVIYMPVTKTRLHLLVWRWFYPTNIQPPLHPHPTPTQYSDTYASVLLTLDGKKYT